MESMVLVTEEQASEIVTTQKESFEIPVGYKMTELGLIPEDWDVKLLKDLVLYTNGKAHEDIINNNGKFIVVNSKFISTEGRVKKFSDFCYAPASLGEVLMVMSDVPNGKAIAKCFFVDKDNCYTVNQRICLLHPKQINAKLIFYKLDRNPFYLAFDDGAKQTNLRKNEVLQCPISIPKSAKEQLHIAVALSDIDSLIASLEKLIAKKRHIKLAAMQQLLTGKQRLPGFSRDWKMKQLGEITQIVSGGTPKTNIDLYWNGKIKWCTPTDITRSKDKYLFDTERTISSKGLASCSAQLLPIGTLLMCSRATIGDIRIATCEICTNQGFKSLICSKEVYNEFLYYLLQTLKSKIIEKAIGSTFLEISKKDTAALEIILPSHQEQIAIANVLSDMDIEISSLEQQLDKARNLKQGMMQELLTGRIRLK